MSGGAGVGAGGAGGLSAMMSDPGVMSMMAQKLAAQANPDVIQNALIQMEQAQAGGIGGMGMGSPIQMGDVLGTNPMQSQPRTPALDATHQVNLGNSAMTGQQIPTGAAPPPSANLDPRSAALLSQMAAGRAERPQMAPAPGIAPGRGVNVDFSSLIFNQGARAPNPRAPALAHLLGLVR